MASISLAYGIGDIHGQHQKLRRLLQRCQRDAAWRGAEKRVLVFLGDYVDRGPASRQVVELLINLQRDNGPEVICLKGNHEQILVAAAKDALSKYNVTLNEWLERGGGAATLKSYGVAHPAELPADHLDWMESLPLSHDDGQRFFCHAGINPALGCEGSGEDDLLLIREPFLSASQDFGRLIVHGHTPTPSRNPEVRRNRVNLDTAAGYGGPITAAVF